MKTEKCIFLYKDGKKYYKTDTWWSLSIKKEHSKTHPCYDDKIEEHLLRNLNNLINGLWNKKENMVEKYPFYIDCLIGFENQENKKSKITNKIIVDGDKFKIIDFDIIEQRKLKLERILK